MMIKKVYLVQIIRMIIKMNLWKIIQNINSGIQC